MAVTFSNRAKQLLIVPLNSGKSLHLAPGETSAVIADAEIVENAKIAKLLKASLLVANKAIASATPKLQSTKRSKKK